MKKAALFMSVLLVGICVVYVHWAFGYTPQKRVTLAADETAVQVGLPVTLTATLSDGAASTPIQFTSDGQNVGDPVNTDAQGEATLIYTPGAQGTHTLKAIKADYDGSNCVEITGVTVTLKAKTAADDDWAPGDITIVAGGINNDSHKAQLLVEATPAVAARIQVSLAGGQGHGGSNNAKAVLGGVTVNPGETKKPKTSGEGKLTGYLLSSNVLNDATVTAGNDKKVFFGWDNYTGSDAWVSDPFELIPDSNSGETVTFQCNDLALVGHDIHFYVERVEYEDDDGTFHALINTADNPSDVSGWAEFTSDTASVDEDGAATATLAIKNRPEIIAVELRAYDFSVWAQP